MHCSACQTIGSSQTTGRSNWFLPPVDAREALERGDGTRVLAAATFLDDLPTRRGSGIHRDRLRFVGFPMAKGNYSVTGYIFDPSGLHIWDQAVLTDCLHPESQGWTLSLLRLDHDWDFDRGGE